MNPLHRLYFWRHERRLKKLNEGYDYQVATPELTAKRFKLLFNLHGIEVSEIPEVKGFESITLHDLNSNDRLIQKLTPEFLKKTATIFGIRIEWLRSGEPVLYRHRHWYKTRLKDFFEDLKEIDFENTYDPFIVLTTHDKLDVDNPEYQPFVLVLRKHIGIVDEKDIYKYYMESVWDWHHSPCRLQAKALATKYYELTDRIITMYTVESDEFYKITQGYIPPKDELLMFNHKISFEEYATDELPHIHSFEVQEFTDISQTIKDYGLGEISYKYITSPVSGEEIKAPPKRKVGRKPSAEKKEIKERFVNYYLEIIRSGTKKSVASAARDFFNKLEPDEEQLLFRSQSDYKRKTTDELTENAERTLREYYAEYKNRN